MGTRGVYGFHKNGIDKLAYNHWDSYPEGLGQDVVSFIRSCSISELNDIFDRIILVDENNAPTKEQIEECRPYLDLNVSNQSENDWYCLVRKAQGNLEAYKNGLKYMLDSNDFIKNSLFCEWGYIINLDNNVLEIYKGFQETPQKNRYYTQEGTGVSTKYYNCALTAEILLDNIPQNWCELLKEDEEE